MSEKLSDKEVTQAGEALIQWFISQDITPADGSFVMARVIASQLVHKTTNHKELETAVELFKMLMLVQIAGILREDNDQSAS